MTPAEAQQLAAVTLTMVAVSFALGAGLYVWYSVMLARVFAHAGLTPWSAWVPVYSQMQVFRLGGQNPWLALLLLVPIAQLAGLFFLILALHRISGQYWRGVGTTVLGVLLPPVWATVLALGPSPDPERGRMPVRGASSGAIPPVAPGVTRDAALAAVTAGWPAGDSAPILPAWADLHPRGAAPLPPMPTAAPVPASAQPPASARPLVPAQPHVPASAAAVAGPIADPISRIPGRIEPIPAMPAASVAPQQKPAPGTPIAPTLPTLPPAGSPFDLAPDAAPVAAPDAAPVAAPNAAPVFADLFAVAAPVALAEPVPAAAVATAAATAIAATEEDLDDDPLDRTIVVARKPKVTWHLVPDGGEPLRLAGGTVLLGRNPRVANPEAGEVRLVVPDPSRTLSKTHAVLQLDGEQWTITDLHSTNGVLVPDGFGEDQLLDPDVPTLVPDRFVLGTLSVRIDRDPPIAGVPGR